MSPPPTALSVGLSGGVASGKSAVAARLQQLGAELIDADVISRELVAPGQPALTEIAAALGSQAIDADGRLDRRRVRELIFADAAARAALESILHPRVEQRMHTLAAGAQSPYVVLAIPLLAEVGRYRWLDRVVIVDCPAQLQLQRLVQRDGISTELAASMIAAQASRETRNAIADEILLNDGSVEALVAQVDALHLRLLALARAR